MIISSKLFGVLLKNQTILYMKATQCIELTKYCWNTGTDIFCQEHRGNISFVPASTISPWPNKVAYVYLAVSVPSYETGWLWIICDAIWAKHTSVAMRLLNGIYDHTIQVMLRFYYTVENNCPYSGQQVTGRSWFSLVKLTHLLTSC